MHKSLARYKARHILVEDIDDAEYVLEKLSAGEDFTVVFANNDEMAIAENSIAVLAVAGQPGKVRHQGIAALG